MKTTQQLRPIEGSEEIQTTAVEETPMFYDGLYAPSGFDIMAVLVRMAPCIDIRIRSPN